MGCGCKTKNNETVLDYEDVTVSGSTEEIKNNLTIGDKLKNFLLRKNKFSFFGLILFLFFFPTMLLIMSFFVMIILFNKLVLGKNTDIIGLLAFKKVKK